MILLELPAEIDENFCVLITITYFYKTNKGSNSAKCPKASFVWLHGQGDVLSIACPLPSLTHIDPFYTLSLHSIWASKTLKLDAFESSEGNIFNHIIKFITDKLLQSREYLLSFDNFVYLIVLFAVELTVYLKHLVSSQNWWTCSQFRRC